MRVIVKNEIKSKIYQALGAMYKYIEDVRVVVWCRPSYTIQFWKQ